MVTATTATHVSMSMTMAALYENDAVTVGERIRFCCWYRKRR
jgi:hypothetical protein